MAAKDASVEAVLKKTSWKSAGGSAWTFFCSLCRSRRVLPAPPVPGTPRQLVQVGLTALVITLGLWKWCGMKGLLSFVPLWAGFEAVYRLRMRVALRCPHCGFDPLLYHRDIPGARQEVEAFWRKKFADKGIPYPEKGAEPAPSAPSPGDSPS